MYQNDNFLTATASIQGGETFPSIVGRVHFYQKRDHVLVEATMNGLPVTDTGFFGFHIHEGGACTGVDFSDTKGHYNPTGASHPAHAGDLPPLLFCNGGAYCVVATDRFRVADIVGKTVVIHDMPDDFHTQPAGNAGTKIACGVIRTT